MRATSRTARITPAAGFALIPAAAVGRTAGAVGGLADSGMLVGMTRGRAWIALLGVLLVGIVGLNVWALGMSASTSGVSTEIAQLERENSVLGAKIASKESVERVRRQAARVGLGVPAPKAVTYLKLRSGDLGTALERLGSGLAVSGALVASAPADADPATTEASAAAGEPATAPAVVPEPAPDPAAAAAPVAPAPTPAPEPAPPAEQQAAPVAPAASGGGVAP